METITVSLDLDEILRECIDRVAVYKRKIDNPDEILEKSKLGKELTEDEDKQLDDWIISSALKIFLNSKEMLIIPEDAAHKFADHIVKRLDDLKMKFAYQDFYAYQFVDKLPDVVRRAFKIRDVFSKKHISDEVKTICKEAYLSFIQGYHIASIALCRSIVESLLKDRLNVDIGELQKLNDIAYGQGFYLKRTWDRIDQIRRSANKFLHQISKGNTPSEFDNLKILGFTQEVLQTFMN